MNLVTRRRTVETSNVVIASMVRFKNRYLLCEIVFPDNQLIERKFTDYEIYRCIKDSLADLHGDYGLGIMQSSLSVKYVNPHTHVVLVRAMRGAHQMVWQAMTFIKKIGSQEAFFRALHLGGTIRTCQKFLLDYHRKQLAVLLKQCKKQEQIAIQQSILNSSIDPKDEFREPFKDIELTR